VLAFHSVLKPEILTGFAGVLMAGANFEDSAIFRIWAQKESSSNRTGFRQGPTIFRTPER
jgi:hypothetical protein